MSMNNDSTIHREFTRTFIAGAPADGNNSTKIKNDPRVTRIGRLLRRTSLDELPQFVNVLKGEMSLVGPRPCIPYEFECYDLWHRRRVLALPGITGLWQVTDRTKVSFNDMVGLDLRYLREWSLWLDLKILATTPRAVFGGKGAH